MSDSTALSPRDFATTLNVSRETLARLETYAHLLERWQARINLVSGRSLGDLWRRHFLDSAQALPIMPADAAPGPVYDVGSGAGFPGLVLSILGISDVRLIESDARKCVFLREAVRLTGADADVIHGRLPEIARDGGLPSGGVILARGLAPLPKLLDIVFPVISPATCCIFLKGAGADAEISDARSRWRFDLDKIQSCTSPDGVLLKLTGICHDGTAHR